MPKKILIADDDVSLVTVLMSRLQKHNYEVIAAFDAAQALGLAHSSEPDLIILDIKMPAGTGESVLKNLKISTKTFSIPIIVMTAYPNDELRQSAIEKGVVDFFEKPFQIDKLLASIKKVFGEYDREYKI